MLFDQFSLKVRPYPEYVYVMVRYIRHSEIFKKQNYSEERVNLKKKNVKEACHGRSEVDRRGIREMRSGMLSQLAFVPPHQNVMFWTCNDPKYNV